jgi:hypothetical protein
MKKAVWPRTARRSTALAPDPAPAALTRVATEIGDRASAVLRMPVATSTTDPVRGADFRQSRCRTWRCESGGVMVWLALDDAALRGLLEAVLGGPGASVPTALERDIVRETIERLIASDAMLWEEAPRERMPADDFWLCEVRIETNRSSVTRLSLLAAAAIPDAAPERAKLDHGRIPIVLSIGFPASGHRLESVLRWGPGSLVPIGASAPTASVYAGRREIASGRIGAVRGRRAVMIESLAAPRG